MQLFLFHLFVAASALFSSLSHGVLFPPIQVANEISKINIPYFLPEGLTYHEETDRILLSSLSTGEIRAFPNTNRELNSMLNQNSSTLIYSGSLGGIFTPVVGIKAYGNTLYGAVGSIPPLTGPFYGGLLIIDLQTPSVVDLVDFSPLFDGLLMTPNDVAFSSSSNAVFVTDFYSYRLFKYDISTTTISTIMSRGILCTICSTTTIAYDGPNGITTKDDYLLVARSGTLAYGSTPAILKVPIDNTSAAIVIPILPDKTSTESILDGADGLIFDSNEEILYVTNNGKDLVVAIRSTYNVEDWTSGQVVFSYSTGCQYKDPSTSTIVSQTGDVVVICTEQFGAGPYSLKRLPGVANNFAAVKDFSYDLTLSYLIPEGIVYQPSTDTLLYTSFGRGEIYSTFNPSVPISSGYALSRGTMKKIIDAFPASSVLLGIQVDPKYDHLAWGAYNILNGVGGGIYRCNTMKGSCDIILDLDISVNGAFPAFYNDVTIDPIDGTVYCSDTGSHKIESLKPTDRSGVDDNTVEKQLIATDICIDCSSTCDGTGACGPNGLALIPNGKKKASALVTGVYSTTTSSNGFFRIDIADGTKTRLTVVPDTFVDNLDGMRFDDQGEFLFVAAFTTDTISAYYSCDDWKETMYLAGVFQGGCSDGSNTAVTYTSNGDLVITCVDSFGSGPYTSTRITNIRSRLLGISYSSIEDFCEGEEPFDLDGDGDGDDEDEDDEDDDEQQTLILVLSILTSLLGVIALVYGLLYHFHGPGRGGGGGVAQEKNNSSAELTSTQNIIRQ